MNQDDAGAMDGSGGLGSPAGDGDGDGDGDEGIGGMDAQGNEDGGRSQPSPDAGSCDDQDEDGLCDDVDPCPVDPENDADHDGACESQDPCPDDINDDSDADGICDSLDVCPLMPDGDEDHDGVCDTEDPDKCPKGDMDSDGDGWADLCDEVLWSVSGEARYGARAVGGSIWLHVVPDEDPSFSIEAPALGIEESEVTTELTAPQLEMLMSAGTGNSSATLRIYLPPSTYGLFGESKPFSIDSDSTLVRMVVRGESNAERVSGTIEIRGYATQ